MTSPSAPAPDPADARAWRHALAILAATTLVRLVIGAVVPLFPDETYYWDWSRTLRFGYFDHPPMIALLVRAGTVLLGHSALGVRLWSIVAGTGAAFAVALTARELAGGAAARLATAIFASMPLAAAGFVLATPDAPMLCFVAWALYAVVRAIDDPSAAPGRATRWWLAAGAFIGLAMASKYTSVLVPAAIAVAFLLHPRLQNRFGERGPYLAVAVAALVLVPVLYWNARHDWVSFRFQLGHGLGQPKGGVVAALNRELELVGGQIGLVSPILFYLVVRAVRRGLDPTPDGVRLVLAVVPVSCALFFIWSASRRSVEANWPAIAWLPAVVLLATDPPVSRTGRRWLAAGLALGAALSAIIYVHVIHPVLPLPATRDQVAKAWGWGQLAGVIDRRRNFVLSRASSGRDVFVAAERYQDASELAFHLDGHPRVFSINLVGRPNQYDLWLSFTDRAAPGASLILVLDDEPAEPRDIHKLSCCFHIDEGESVALMRGDEFVTRKRLWYLTGWTGEWPLRAQPFPWTN